jgi:hypothetical protein
VVFLSASKKTTSVNVPPTSTPISRTIPPKILSY